MKISLFVTCYNDTLFPETGKAVVRLLERLGHTVEFPVAQSCCGQMHYNTGYQHEALSLFKHFLAVFAGSDVVCIPSSSCVAHIRDHFPKMAAASGNPGLVEQVESVLSRTFELSELLVHKLGITDVGAYYPHKVTLHTSCHSIRSLHLHDTPVQLLENVRGLTLVDLPGNDQCCGFGGTFSIKNADTSVAMLSEKLEHLLACGAEVCTAVDNSCLMHIGGVLRRRGAPIHCVHFAEILAAQA